jgi:hypothetical protein
MPVQMQEAARITGDRGRERARAADAWAFRWGVEILAERGFRRLTSELDALDAPEDLVRAAATIAGDEARHVELCRGLATFFGASDPVVLEGRESLAPRGIDRAQATIYDLVARCCIAETESTATLVSLATRGRAGCAGADELGGAASRVREVVLAIARDEVAHARLGWRALAHFGRDAGALAFLSNYLPSMLRVGGEPLFERLRDEGDLVEYGVFGIATRRSIFVETLDEVVFPGLELHGIATATARAWLAGQERRLAADAP